MRKEPQRSHVLHRQTLRVLEVQIVMHLQPGPNLHTGFNVQTHQNLHSRTPFLFGVHIYRRFALHVPPSENMSECWVSIHYFLFFVPFSCNLLVTASTYFVPFHAFMTQNVHLILEMIAVTLGVWNFLTFQHILFFFNQYFSHRNTLKSHRLLQKIPCFPAYKLYLFA